jgi:hypothetical protein
VAHFEEQPLSGQVLDRTERIPSPCALLVMRSVGGDHDAFTHWLSLNQDDLARGVVLDTIDLDTPVCRDDFIAWWASALPPVPCVRAPR